jgi:hypothetical protein
MTLGGDPKGIRCHHDGSGKNFHPYSVMGIRKKITGSIAQFPPRSYTLKFKRTRKSKNELPWTLPRASIQSYKNLKDKDGWDAATFSWKRITIEGFKSLNKRLTQKLSFPSRNYHLLLLIPQKLLNFFFFFFFLTQEGSTILNLPFSTRNVKEEKKGRGD